jgi:hypothetical protein
MYSGAGLLVLEDHSIDAFKNIRMASEDHLHLPEPVRRSISGESHDSLHRFLGFVMLGKKREKSGGGFPVKNARW